MAHLGFLPGVPYIDAFPTFCEAQGDIPPKRWFRSAKLGLIVLVLKDFRHLFDPCSRLHDTGLLVETGIQATTFDLTANLFKPP